MKILVLAGGFDQKDLILELKRRGHRVLLADYLEHPPAREAADAFHRISTLDMDAVRDLARNEGVDRVTTACTDQALLTAARVSADLGLLFYLSYETALSVTNKSFMKKILTEQGVPTSPYRILSEYGIVDPAEIPFPRVVKPVDSNSSRGVRKVMDDAGMKVAVQSALAESRSRTALVEGFLPGKELSVDAYIQHGQAHVLMISETVKVPDRDGFTIVQSRVPAGIDEATCASVQSICTGIARAFALPDTPLLVQCVAADGKAHVLEFSARMGGGTKHRLIQAVAGVDLMAVFVDRLEDKPVALASVEGAKAASLTYCYVQPGTFHQLNGVETLKEEGVIDQLFVYKAPGTALTQAATSGDRVCGYLITGKNRDEVASKERTVRGILHILDPQGLDLFRRDLLPN